MSDAQHARQTERDAAGRYVKNPCNCCGKPAPMVDYYSDDRCNVFHGYGLVLRARCATRLAKLSDADYEAEARARGYGVHAPPVSPGG